MIEWNPIGPRFSNVILQTLVTLLQTPPPKGHRLLILATTSRRSVMDQLDVMSAFAREIPVPSVQDTRELATVLSESRIFGSNQDINEAVNTVQSYTNSSTVGVGIKTILTTASTAVESDNPGQWFGEQLATEIGRYNSL